MRRIKCLWERKELGRIIKAIWTITSWLMTSRSCLPWASSMTIWKNQMIGSSPHRSTVHYPSQPWIARIVNVASSKEKSYNYTLLLGKVKHPAKIHTFYRRIRWNLLRRTCSTGLRRKIMTSFLIWIIARLQSWAAVTRGGWQAWPQLTKASQPIPQLPDSSRLRMNLLQIWVCTVNSSRSKLTLHQSWHCHIHTERTRNRAPWTAT